MGRTAKEIYNLIINLRNSEEKIQNDSIKEVPVISSTIGSYRTVSELIPYIVETPTFSENQWILILNVIPKIDIGKYNEAELKMFFTSLIPISKLESRIIRSEFVKCCMLLAKNIKAEQISEILNPFLTKILGKRPVVRAAGIAVYANVISLISTQLKSTIFESLAKNINKEPIIVRQSFTASCPLIIPYLDDNQISTLLSIISIMAEDDCFSVSCEIPNALAKYLEQHSDIEQVLKIGDKLLNSKNWRVKCTYIDSVSDIFKGHSIEFGMIYPILKKVVFSLVEEEDEVKTAAAQQMHFLSTLQNVEANKIKILFKNFFSAHCPHIKTAAISQLPYYVGILDNDYIINQFKGLVKDSSEEVKIAAIETLQSERIPTDIKLHCIEISSDSIQWREKDEIVRLLPQLSGVPDKKFDSSFMQLLFDDAFNVRKAALELLPNLISQRKESFKSMLMRRLWSSMDGDDYQLRQTAVLAVIKGNLFDKDGIEILKQAAEDEIPNVRLTLAMNIPRDEKFADIIAKLKKDSDEDVANCFN